MQRGRDQRADTLAKAFNDRQRRRWMMIERRRNLFIAVGVGAGALIVLNYLR